jgi:hypothetical protein
MHNGVVLLHETLGEATMVVILLESIFKGFCLFGFDSFGRSRALAMGWNPKSIKLENYLGFNSDQSMFVFF